MRNIAFKRVNKIKIKNLWRHHPHPSLCGGTVVITGVFDAASGAEPPSASHATITATIATPTPM
jgi:hypothetical protein